jgi:thiamine phosphate synthase YjbQ (UPF0047 family)
MLIKETAMQRTITISTDCRNALYDITAEVNRAVKESEIRNGKPGLSTYQNIFFCEFDGPTESREIVITTVSCD